MVENNGTEDKGGVKRERERAAGTVKPLYGRCMELTMGGRTWQLKVMGADKAIAKTDRDKLFAALGKLGISVKEDK